ncbi:MAG: hypothetical protein ACE5FM_10435 [Methyloligellaceae bacterium]
MNEKKGKTMPEELPEEWLLELLAKQGGIQTAPGTWVMRASLLTSPSVFEHPEANKQWILSHHNQPRKYFNTLREALVEARTELEVSNED